MCTEYLAELYLPYTRKIKDVLKGQDFYVILDETTDTRVRCALVILLQPVEERPIMADWTFLDKSE